ncbi:MAG TPA: hypothetical protein VLO09_09355 [Ornithinimicrobium sp.]|nr:hypothetical protein [Ornithinimicrobium sp.]
MKTFVIGHGDLGVAARPLGAVAPRSVLRPRVSSVSGARENGRTERPAVATLPTDPTLDPTVVRTT